MKPSEMTQALEALIPTRRPLYLWGPPGVGKSSLVRQAAEANGLQLIDIRAVLLDPVDLRGLPTVKDKLAEWALPSFLPHDPLSKGVVFLDELAQSPPLVQSACLSLTLDRKIGEYTLPEGWTVIAASNRQEDRAGAHRLITPLLNRFIHLDLEVSLDDWQNWANLSGICAEIRSFLQWKPGLLFQFEPSSNVRAFASPRSWQFVNDVLPFTPDGLAHNVFSGCVGEGPATEFIAFLRVYRHLPDLDQLLANAEKATLPVSKPDVMYALTGALAEKSKSLTNLDQLATLGVRMNLEKSGEFSALMLRDTFTSNCQKVDGKLKGKDKLFGGKMSKWIAQHRDVLTPGRD